MTNDSSTVHNGQNDRIRTGVQFAIVPTWVLSAAIPDKAKLVYATLQRRANNDDATCFPSRKLIADDIGGCSTDTVDRALKALASIGAVTWESRRNERGDQTSNLYTVHTTPASVDNSGPDRGGGRKDAATVAASLRPGSRKDAARTRPTEPDPTEAATRAQENTNAERLSTYLAAAIKNDGKGNPTPDAEWNGHMQTLLDNGHTATEIRRHIDWVFLWADDRFWTTRIRSAEHLARSFPKIVEQAAAARDRGSKPRAPGDDGQRPVRQPDVAELDELTEHRKRHVYANLVDASELA